MTISATFFNPIVIRQRYERIAVIDNIDEIFELIRQGQTQLTLEGVDLSLEGLRLQTFATSEACCSNPECQSVPEYFVIERSLVTSHPEFAKYHLNLYGTDHNNKEVLFTHDHTLARGLGGADARDNTTTMCSPCNARKARVECKEVLKMREEDEKLNRPEEYAARIQRETERRLKAERKKLNNLLKAAEHFLNMPHDQLVEHANTQAGDGFVSNNTAYAEMGLTPKGHKWLTGTTMAFFKSKTSQSKMKKGAR